jgi:aminopeptidase 2
MGQMSLLGASVAILLLINTIGATVIPLQKFRINSERYSESSKARAADEAYRLPQTATPVNYTITLTPDYDKFATFTGEVEIWVTAETDGNNISLHYDNMTIHSRTVFHENGDELDLDDDHYDNTTNIYTLILYNQTFKPGEKYKIYINYTGHLLDDMAGFYRSSYKTANGEIR